MLSLGALADVDEIAVRGTEEVVAAPVALPNLPKLLSSNLIEFHNFGPILESTFQGYSIWTYKTDRKADRKMAQKNFLVPPRVRRRSRGHEEDKRDGPARECRTLLAN